MPGRTLAVAVMLTGYGIIAVPTGIVTAEMLDIDRKNRPKRRRQKTQRRCPDCDSVGHDADAQYCKYCGAGMAE